MIRELITRQAERAGKHSAFELHESMRGRSLAGFMSQMAAWKIRGWVLARRLASSGGVVLAGRGVRVRYPHHVSAGRAFFVEDYAEIMGWSTEGITFGDGVTIGAFSTIKPSSYYGRNPGVGLTVGDRSNIGRYSYIGCSGRITIGSDVMMAPGVSMFAEEHAFSDSGQSIKAQGVVRSEIVIEDDCWIASRAVILAGVRIGAGSVVASGAVVSKDVPPNSIVAGVPARVIRERGGSAS